MVPFRSQPTWCPHGVSESPTKHILQIYHVEITIKCMLIMIISSGHFYSIWINLTSYHTTEINVTAASQCMLLIIVLCVSVWMRGVLSVQTQTHVAQVFSRSVSQYMRTRTHEFHLQSCSENHFTSFMQFHLRNITSKTAETERPSQAVKIKVRFNSKLWPNILLLYTKMQFSN